MHNEKYRDIFYNEDVKERYLRTLSESTGKVVLRLFKRSYNLESVLKRDLYDFNLRELSQFLYHLKSSTLASVRANISNVSGYIRWAISEGYRLDNSNPLEGLPIDWVKQFVNKNEDDYFNKKTLDEVIIPKLFNKQDSAIVQMLFEGISGNELWEIRNLTPNAIDFENQILRVKTSEHNGEEREVKVSEKCIDLIEYAIKETEYHKRNGDISDLAKNNTPAQLIETGFVIKPSKMRNAHFEQISFATIGQRLKKMADLLEIRALGNYSKVRQSGMIYMGYELYLRDGVLDKEQYLEICKQFNVHKTGDGTYNWGLLKEVVNLDTIKQLYPDVNVAAH